LPANVIAR